MLDILKEKKERVGLEEERIKYWLSQGAQPTTRVARILGENKMMEMPEKGNNPQKAIPKKDRKKEESDKILKQIFEHQARLDLTCRFNWTENAVCIGGNINFNFI